jgi:hypothetical protein
MEAKRAGAGPVVAWFVLYAATAIGFGVALWWLLARAATALGWPTPGGVPFIVVFVIALIGLPLAAFVAFATIVAPRLRRRRIARLTALVGVDRPAALKGIAELVRHDLEADDPAGANELLPLLASACGGRAERELAEFRRALEKIATRVTTYGRPGAGSHGWEDLSMIELDDAAKEALDEVVGKGMKS